MVDNQQMVDFLCFSYFGIKPNCNDEEIILKCIERAYRDLNRTINFTYSQSVLDNKSDKTLSKDAREKYIDAKQKFKSDLIRSIKEAVTNLPETLKENSFRKWHKGLCDTIVDCNPDVDDSHNVKVLKNNLSYGQAQKWVNMTLKYMWLMGLIEDQKQLCVPIDNYILKALRDEKSDVAPFIIVKDGDTYKVKHKNAETAYSWSKFPDACFYYGLDEKIKSIIGDEMPLEWENKMWLKASQPNESEDSHNAEVANVRAG